MEGTEIRVVSVRRHAFLFGTGENPLSSVKQEKASVRGLLRLRWPQVFERARVIQKSPRITCSKHRRMVPALVVGRPSRRYRDVSVVRANAAVRHAPTAWFSTRIHRNGAFAASRVDERQPAWAGDVGMLARMRGEGARSRARPSRCVSATLSFRCELAQPRTFGPSVPSSNRARSAPRLPTGPPTRHPSCAGSRSRRPPSPARRPHRPRHR